MQVDLDLSLIGLTLRPQSPTARGGGQRPRRKRMPPTGTVRSATRHLLSHCQLQLRSLTVYLPDTGDPGRQLWRQGAVLALLGTALSTLIPLLHSASCQRMRVLAAPSPGQAPELDLLLRVRLYHLLPPLLLLLVTRRSTGKIKKKGS